jgi:hypothetical protein
MWRLSWILLKILNRSTFSLDSYRVPGNLTKMRSVCKFLHASVQHLYLYHVTAWEFRSVHTSDIPPLRSIGWSSWLQIQRSGFDSRSYHIWEVVDLERGPLSLVSRTEELLERKSSGSGLETREHCHRDPSRWPRGTPYSQKLALTSSTSGARGLRPRSLLLLAPDVTVCAVAVPFALKPSRCWCFTATAEVRKSNLEGKRQSKHLKEEKGNSWAYRALQRKQFIATIVILTKFEGNMKPLIRRNSREGSDSVILKKS